MISELTEELTAKDIPWLMETVEDCGEEGRNKVADLLERVAENNL